MKKNKVESIASLKEICGELNEDLFSIDFLNYFNSAKCESTAEFEGLNDINGHAIVHLIESRTDTLSDLLSFCNSLDFSNTKSKIIYSTDLTNFSMLDISSEKIVTDKVENTNYYILKFLSRSKEDDNGNILFSIEDMAAKRLSELLSVIFHDIDSMTNRDLKSAELFSARLVFCIIASSRGALNNKCFMQDITSKSEPDGSNIHICMQEIFKALGAPERIGADDEYIDYPYVGGDLFKSLKKLRKFNSRSRAALFDLFNLEWDKVNASLFCYKISGFFTSDNFFKCIYRQSHKDITASLIHESIISELKDSLEYTINGLGDSSEKITRLENLLSKIEKIRVVDIHSGSGLILSTSMKMINELKYSVIDKIIEMRNLYQIYDGKSHKKEPNDIGLFVGLESRSFEWILTKISTWMTYIDESKKVGIGSEKMFPLHMTKDIRFSKNNDTSFFSDPLFDQPVSIISNIADIEKIPIGDLEANYEYTDDFDKIFKESKMLNYLWIKESLRCIRNKDSRISIITKRNQSREELKLLIDSELTPNNLEIYLSIKDRCNTGETVSISIRRQSAEDKFIIDNNEKKKVRNISHLLDDSYGATLRGVATSKHRFVRGCSPMDGGNMIMTDAEASQMVIENPLSRQFIKKYINKNEFYGSFFSWCIWIDGSSYKKASKIKPIAYRINKVSLHRKSKAPKKSKGLKSYEFLGAEKYQNKCFMAVATLDLSFSDYIIADIFSGDVVANELIHVFYDFDESLFPLISSHLFMLWCKAMSCSSKKIMNYSSALFSSFPLLHLSEAEKLSLKSAASKIIIAREMDGRSLSEMYQPGYMSKKLEEAHIENDEAVESIFLSRLGLTEFENDFKRINALVSTYNKGS